MVVSLSLKQFIFLYLLVLCFSQIQNHLSLSFMLFGKRNVEDFFLMYYKCQYLQFIITSPILNTMNKFTDWINKYSFVLNRKLRLNIFIRYFSLLSWQKQHCDDHCFSNDAMNTAMLSLRTRSEFHSIETCCVCVCVWGGGACVHAQR